MIAIIKFGNIRQYCIYIVHGYISREKYENIGWKDTVETGGS